MQVKRIRYIEKDFIFKRIKDHSEYLTDEKINNILDEHKSNWCDITIVFCINGNAIKSEIFDNYTNEIMSVNDLNFNAAQFYESQFVKLIQEHPIQIIRSILHREKAAV